MSIRILFHRPHIIFINVDHQCGIPFKKCLKSIFLPTRASVTRCDLRLSNRCELAKRRNYLKNFMWVDDCSNVCVQAGWDQMRGFLLTGYPLTMTPETQTAYRPGDSHVPAKQF